jgi:hypothetical protein
VSGFAIGLLGVAMALNLFATWRVNRARRWYLRAVLSFSTYCDRCGHIRGFHFGGDGNCLGPIELTPDRVVQCPCPEFARAPAPVEP